MKLKKPKTKKILEKDVKRAIKSLLDGLNIWSFPIVQSMGAYRGIPDRFAVYKGKVFVIEVKAPQGKQSDYQIAFQQKWEFNYEETYILARSIDDVIDGMGLRNRFLV